MSEPKDAESPTKTAAASPAPAPAAAARPTGPVVLPPVTVEGTLRYNPYAFAPPAPPPPAPPVAAAAAAAAPRPLLGSTLLGSVQSAVESVATRAGSSVASLDLVHELGLTESMVRSHFPPDAELAVFAGMLSDATDREYRARVGVTQRGLCVTAADTGTAAPHPHAFVHIPYCYLITYVRCRATQRAIPDALRPAPHLDAAPYPAPADGLRLYTTDGRLHVLYRLPVDSLIATFDYWWRLAVHLIAVQPAPRVVYVPYVPQPPPAPLPQQQPQQQPQKPQGDDVTDKKPAAAPATTVATVAATPAGVPMAYPVCQPMPPQLRMSEAQAPRVNMYVVQQSEPSLFGVTQTQGTVLTPSPYKRFVPPPETSAGAGSTVHASHAAKHAPAVHSHHKGYQPLTQDGDDDDECGFDGAGPAQDDEGGIELRSCTDARP